MNFIIESMYVGFVTYSIIYIIVALFKKRKNVVFNEKVDQTATLLIRYTGILYFILFFGSIILYQLGIDMNLGVVSNLDRLNGPYWLAYWIFLFFYVAVDQFLWIKRIRKSIWFRLVLIISISIALSFEKVVIIVTSIHRDSFMGSTKYSLGWLKLFISVDNILMWSFKFLIFGLGVFLLHLVLRKSKKLS